MSRIDPRICWRQLSYAIKNQLKAPKAPIGGLWDEIPPLGGISCLSLVLYGIRAPIIDPFRAWKPPNGGFGCLELVLYGIRELA